MSHFFKSKNNVNKYFIYLLISKDNSESDCNIVKTKIIITKSLILHDLNYIISNYDTIINNEMEYKIIEHYTLTYNFLDNFPIYPYELFIINRVLLHSFLHTMSNKYVKEILMNEKINIVSNINYLKRVKDWSINWKKNRFSIEKYQISNEINESIFSINSLSQYYFNIENNIENDNQLMTYETSLLKNIFICKPMSYEEKSLFERTSERPNTDLIEKCTVYFEEDKQIRFI